MDDDLDERQTVDGVAVLPTTADAVSASVACARALGLPADDPEVIAEGYSVRVRLRPAPVVTRVVTVGRALRPHPLPWLEREVLVAQFLAASGVPIVAPWEDPGPHIAEGLEVCLWHWTEHDSREVSAAGFGAMLGPLHDALARYPGDLPTLIGPLTDISPALAISSDPTLHRAAAELVPLTRSWPARPLHGDAHTGNVLMTPDGPLWTDFEDVCVGPVEWDMASMTITDDALAAYPGPSTGPDSPTAVTCAVCRSSPASWSGTTTTLRSTRRWSRTSTDASTTDPACEGGPTGRSLRGTTARPGCRCRVPKRPSPATTAGTKTREAAAPSSCQPGDDRLPVRDPALTRSASRSLLQTNVVRAGPSGCLRRRRRRRLERIDFRNERLCSGPSARSADQRRTGLARLRRHRRSGARWPTEAEAPTVLRTANDERARSPLRPCRFPDVTTSEAETSTPPPRHWEADVLLRDGKSAHIRPIRPEDAELMVEFYSRVSDESKYYRFFSPMPNLSERDLKRFTRVDHVNRVALVLISAEKMIAVGRYDMVEPGKAEVAFLVEDGHQGRGIGQLLLEHLAQAGRERGIERFIAEVLPDNQAMIHTFKDAGYRVASAYDEGVMELEFSIDPTDTAIGVMAQREHRAESASIERFFRPRSVAVIGASRRQDTIGQALVRNLVTGDFTGRVYVVNPSADAVSGMPAYKTVGDIPGDVDVAIVAVPADAVQDVVLDCAAKGVHGLVVISSGFAETGEEGRVRQRRLVGLSRSYGLRLIGPNALGVINTDPEVSLNASLSSLMPPRGRAGFFCQSGALGSAILEKVNNRGLGLSTFVSAGNRADVSGNDLLQYWLEDDATEVVLLYLESIGNPRKFSRIARRVSRRKPIIAVRSGRSTQGVPMGHAVRKIAAPGQAVDAMFRQAGVIQVDTLEEMFDVAQLLAHQPLPRGRRVAVVGNSDALGLLAADAATGVGLVVNKQVALGADAGAEDFEDALDAAIDDPEVDAVAAIYIPPLNVSGEDVANVLAAVGEQSDKPIVSTFLGAEGVPELLRVPDVAGSSAGRGSVPSYPAVEAAVRALARVVEYAVWLRTPDTPASDEELVDRQAARRVVNELLMHHPEGHDLSLAEQRELLAAYGIELWETVPVGTLDDALAAGTQLGWDVVLKATAPHLRHRPDLAHVWRNIDTAADMTDAWSSLNDLITEPESAGFVVQKNAPPGVPVGISSMEDPLFGPVLSFGIGGPLTELLGDRSFRIPPLAEHDAQDMVREIKASPILFGYRGSEIVDVTEIERLVRRVAQIQNDLPQVRALELPLILAGANGAAVLGGAIRIEPVIDPRSDWFVRRLSTPPGDTLPD